MFIGFENTAGFIGNALINDTDLNSSVVTVDNLLVVPLHPSLVVQLTGLGLLGMLVWRRQKNAAAIAFNPTGINFLRPEWRRL